MVWYRVDKKRTTNDLLQLSIGWLKTHGYLKENAIVNGSLTWKRTCGLCPPRVIGAIIFSSIFNGENRSVKLTYRYARKEDISSDIQIDCSFPYFGGKRYWFLCPQCGRRVAFLYGEKYFLCRHCHNLSYPTQQMDYMSRMLEKSNKYQDKVLENGQRKRWVHRTTLKKYLNMSEDYEIEAWGALYKRMKRLSV